MDAVERLRDEVKKYIDAADEKIVMMIYAMLEVDSQSAWWDNMPDEVKEEMELSIKQADSNNVITHEAVKAAYPQWFTK